MNRAFDDPSDPVDQVDPDGDNSTPQKAWRDYLRAVGLSDYEIAVELGEDPEELEAGEDE